MSYADKWAYEWAMQQVAKLEAEVEQIKLLLPAPAKDVAWMIANSRTVNEAWRKFRDEYTAAANQQLTNKKPE